MDGPRQGMDRFRPPRISVSNSRKKAGEQPGRPLEQAAEVEHVLEAEFAGDLLDRLGGVEHLPLGLPQDPLADQLGEASYGGAS